MACVYFSKASGHLLALSSSTASAASLIASSRILLADIEATRDQLHTTTQTKTSSTRHVNGNTRATKRRAGLRAWHA